MATSTISSYDTSSTNIVNQKISQLKNNSKNRLYDSLSEYTKLTQNKKNKFVTTYAEKFESQSNKGKLSVEELKKDLEKEFTNLTFLSFEPERLVNNKHYCYIDKDNLKKMSKNPQYRAEVYALLQREDETISNGYKYKSNSQVVKSEVNSSIITLSSENDLSNKIAYSSKMQLTDKVSGIQLSHIVKRDTETTMKNSDLVTFIKNLSSKQKEQKQKSNNAAAKTPTNNALNNPNNIFESSFDFSV